MIDDFTVFMKNPLRIYIRGSGRYVKNFLCNLEKESEIYDEERLEKIRQDNEHLND